MLDPRYNPPYRLPKNPRDWIDPRRIEMQRNHQRLLEQTKNTINDPRSWEDPRLKEMRLNHQRTVEQNKNNPNNPVNWRSPLPTDMELNRKLALLQSPQHRTNPIQFDKNYDTNIIYDLDIKQQQQVKENLAQEISFLDQNVKDFVVEILCYSVPVKTKIKMLIEEQSALVKKNLLDDAKNVQVYVDYLYTLSEFTTLTNIASSSRSFIKQVPNKDIRVFIEEIPSKIQVRGEGSIFWQTFSFPPNTDKDLDLILLFRKAKLGIEIVYHVDVKDNDGERIIDYVRSWTGG